MEIPKTAVAMTYRDYLIAHAPPMPTIMQNRIFGFATTDHPIKLGGFNEFADQEARWRAAYADAVLERKSKRDRAIDHAIKEAKHER